MDFPQNLKYTDDHEWIKVENNIGIIGITAHAASELGDIVYIDIPNPKAEVKKGESFGTIEAVKTVAELLSPVSGKIIEVNNSLNDAPETVNSDPYNAGWIVKMELSAPAEIDSLMTAEDYNKLIS